MKQTLNVLWLDTVSQQDFITMIKNLPKFKPTSNIRPQEDRDDIKLPLFNKAFDDCSRRLGRVPSQEEYADYYVSLCKKQIEQYDLDPYWLRERAKRNIFSFIQEYMVYILLRDDKVCGLFDRTWDIKGVDFLIYQNGKLNDPVGILQHANTPKAIYKSKLKDKFRRKGINFPTWSLITDIDRTENINGVYLFTSIEDVRACLDKH